MLDFEINDIHVESQNKFIPLDFVWRTMVVVCQLYQGHEMFESVFGYAEHQGRTSDGRVPSRSFVYLITHWFWWIETGKAQCV